MKRKHATIGNDNVGLGPTIVLLHLAKGDPWVVGVLANNVWSLGNSNGSPAYNNALVEPFVNYNFPGGNGLYFTSAPE
ncbi:conserved hypothetical protein [Burkholderiales bacterium]|nr:conserved hypothetical protein [Burkholderiales bacterium]